MRAVKTRLFYIKNKVMPFSQLPQLVHEYFSEQGLADYRFLYHLSEGLYEPNRTEPVSCARALKDMPWLGKTRRVEDHFFLSNIDADDKLTDGKMLPYMEKLQRRYGFWQMCLYWYDADFFGEVIKLEHDKTWTSRYKEWHGKEPDPMLQMYQNIIGSGIYIEKWNCLNYTTFKISVDLLRNGKAVDVDPYLSAMSDKLPGVEYDDSTRVCLTDEERAETEKTFAAAKPLIEQARTAFAAQGFEPDVRQKPIDACYAIGPIIKKLAKPYGFTHKCITSGYHRLRKNTAGGHRLTVYADSGPSHGNSFFKCKLSGTGFETDICSANFIPLSQSEFDACAERFFGALGRFEQSDEFRKADGAFPPAPDWFIE